jgi:hypothetical protein
VFGHTDRGPWLFGRRADLCVFGGSALLSFALLAVGAASGVLREETPEWVFVSCIVFVDVAHVWATGFRVYFDRDELTRRLVLYTLVPMTCLAFSTMAYALDASLFWRGLAYVATFHFVRQQVGWVALYARRSGGSPATCAFDKACMYAVTLHPLIVWHTRLPESFSWFAPGDFVPGLSGSVANLSGTAMWGLLAAYALRDVKLGLRGTLVAGRTVLVLSTFACWYVGIVLLRSDFAFTVTNVLIHGIPYTYLAYRYAARPEAPARALATRIARAGLWSVVLTTIVLASLEELGWNALVFHDHDWMPGALLQVSREAQVWLVPLLAVPQLTHYVLDAFVWRVTGDNPVLSEELRAA